MLCPCCGEKIELGVRECGCGARFVGHPLSEPFRVRRYEPVLTTLFLIIITAGGIYYVSRWAAVGAAFVLPAAWRAARLVRRDRELYGGYRVAMAMLVVAIIGGAVAAAYGAHRVSRYFETRRLQQIATTQSAMYRVASLLESYKRTFGSYPRNEEEIKKFFGQSLPADNWERIITYQSYTEALADGSVRLTGISYSSFELRSAGPDGEEGTEDDIIMRNGMFFSPSQIKNNR
jgi:Type II secretion system (T2SS), protein G